MVRRLLIAVAVFAAAGVLGAPAFAAAPWRPAQPDVLLTAHFAIHFDGDPAKEDYTTQTKAGDLGGYFEQAYSAISGYGFQTPIDDSITTPGRIDVYVVDLSQESEASEVEPDGPPPTSGSIDFGVSEIGAEDEAAQAAFAYAELVEMRHWYPPSSDDWAWYASAEWLAAKAFGYQGSPLATLGPWNISLDCADSDPLLQQCSEVAYEAKGWSRWPFFEFLAQRYGATFVTSMYDQQQTSSSSAVIALQAVIGAKGATLDDLFHDFAVRQMIGGWGIRALDAAIAPTATTLTTGIDTVSLGTNTFSVDHLATKYIAFTRGDGKGDHPCFAATLNISVTVPADVNARPVFWWNQPGSPLVAFAASGSTWSAAIPWDTCFWPANKGLLALINPSLTVNSAQFVVTTSLKVDTNTPATPTAPPAPPTIYGGTTPAPTVEVAPSISLFGPLLLRVSTKSPVLRLIVESSGEGKVHATLGSVDLGAPTIRAGNNDLRFTLPASVLSTLRRSSAVGNVLTLTPLSSSGAVSGTAVTRQVAVSAAPKTTKKKK